MASVSLKQSVNRFGATLVFYVVAIALIALIASARPAHAGNDSPWSEWGAAPFALSKGEACEKASAAIDGFEMPLPVKEHFKQALGSTCNGGTTGWIVPGTVLTQMWSGGKRPHLMNNKLVAELPVSRSPGGRSYRKGSVAEAAATLSWTWNYKGETYVLYLPFVCFNWSWRAYETPQAEECVTLAFNAPVGSEVRWGVGSVDGPLPPSACNAQQQGGESWTAWAGECEYCTHAVTDIQKALGPSAMVPHKYRYTASHTKQVLRFSTAVWVRVVYICLEDTNGRRTCGVYIRPRDWDGRRHVQIDDALWVWDAECPS